MDSDAPDTGSGKRSRPPAYAVEHTQGPAFVLDKRCQRNALRVAFVAEKEVGKGHARWWNSALNPHVGASCSSAVQGECYRVGSEECNPISAWVADECNRVWSQELSEEEEVARAYPVRNAKAKEIGARKPEKSFKTPASGGCG